MEHHFGLITGKKQPVPLKSISVTLSINDFVAGVSTTLNYENEEKVPLEAIFVFPMDEDSAVYSFEALVDGKKIVAELQEKMEAHRNYEDALSQGHQAYLLEEDDYSRDVFSCNVGNLHPGSKVAVTLRYVQELPLETDGALRYVLPAILNPRYKLSERSANSCLNIKTPITPLEELPYTLSLVATITSQHAIERIQSNCSLSPIQYLADDKTSAQVSLAEGHKFDRDVELLIYYNAVHSPSVAVEMGMPDVKPDILMGAPSAMVSFYPDIPEVEASRSCGEFVFLMDCSGSMKSPMNNQKDSQLRIEAAKETLLLLLKSLPMGCYFNIYRFGSSYEKFFPESMKYTQKTMEEAVERVKDLEADLGGTEILTPLLDIYKAPCIPGHPLQLFVFTDGEVSDTFSVIKEVQLNSKKHRCFSFGIGEGASTSLIKGIARVSGGSAEFITSKDRMQTKALGSLKFALSCSADDIALSWDLPPGLLAYMLSPEQTVIFRGQRLIVYAQLTGTMPQVESSGEVCLKYTLQGRSLENRVTFSLQPKTNASFTIHRLAAKSLIQTKDLGSYETSQRTKEDVVSISIQSGVLSSFTAYIAINKELNQPVQGPLAHRVIPRPVMSTSFCACKVKSCRNPALFSRDLLCLHTRNDTEFSEAQSSCFRKENVASMRKMKKSDSSKKKTNLQNDHKGFGENVALQLILLQKANGSWELDEDLTKILGTNLEDIKAANPAKDGDPSAWATVLAVLWLHANGKDTKYEWELLERKAVTWLHDHAGPSIPTLVQAANHLLKLPVTPAVLSL
nr:von Willebrand factor A domain-containing protein 5A-like [Peromyscus maniculatus bairdii]XP_015841726.2 von Willebrand factor A domain-containing protein 5A-like [Peromyscus maniculatus bairdii]XP_042136618.1 von Willebrand factor A domain-containing protein 5A-like [Peromyscus maniculatus bairdii]XP_042136619.1 von Willebrand factor A domain-containing protein 5A-like [Peromyscus maniculatus bairdii]